jgi:hypothetical protein
MDPWFIDRLNLRVFLQLALIYLCLQVTTVTFCIGVTLIEVNPINVSTRSRDFTRREQPVASELRVPRPVR